MARLVPSRQARQASAHPAGLVRGTERPSRSKNPSDRVCPGSQKDLPLEVNGPSIADSASQPALSGPEDDTATIRGAKVPKTNPLIGVLIKNVYPDSSKGLFGAITAFCQELDEASRQQNARVFIFTVEGITPGSSQVSGWQYSDGSWKRGTFPVPSVIYNRLTSRVLEARPKVQQFFREAKSAHGSKVFNEKYLNKTEVFQALKNDEACKSFLPESHPFKNYAMLQNMCNKYPVVFLKPVLGSLGKGILRITELGDKTYSCEIPTVNGTNRKVYRSLSKLFSAQLGKLKTSRYQIQQGLALIHVGGRPVDFRALVQKDQKGEWAVTSVVARIAGANHFVSNLARGGSLGTVKETLARTSLPAADLKKISDQIRKAAVAVAAGIQTNIPSLFGELGVDLAVDTSGRVWLLEVNSKPSKNDNTPLDSSGGKIRPSVRRVIRYSKYLAAQT
ncbi:YheC/YheD family protein [Paenibacillus sp. FJAT-26967]|uniref:YheC/YheD family endospore coat-associated protein n=1 Tax=Paenibacillus sp. FJAT-26967 TaxID=1729690 RepID=UPI000838C381|nr:YheC/YheD family protein [Paenibacillus sp. FJAT-26967]